MRVHDSSSLWIDAAALKNQYPETSEIEKGKRLMMWINALRSGITIMWQHRRMLAVFYWTNLLLGIVLMLPFRVILIDFLGESLKPQQLAGAVDINFWIELIKFNAPFVPLMGVMLGMMSALYWGINLFFSGGVFGVMSAEKEALPRFFWQEATRYFGRFFKLALWSIPLLIVLLYVPMIAEALEALFYTKNNAQVIQYWGKWFRMLLRWMLLLMFFAIFDYARIYTVFTDTRHMRIALLEGMRFVFKYFFQVFPLIGVLWIFSSGCFLGYYYLSLHLKQPDVLIVLGGVVLQQLWVISKITLRLTTYSAEVALFKVHTPSTPFWASLVK